MTLWNVKLITAVRYLCLFVLFLLIGCGGEDSTTVEPPSPEEQVKKALERYAQSGELDSEVVGLREQIEKMKESDPAKADALLSDLSELESMKTPASVKKKAQEMMGKL